MSTLSDKLRKTRESVVEIDGHKFTIRRPTQLEVIEIQSADGGLSLRNAFRFVVDWDLSEIDLGLPGGTGAKVPYDSDAFVEWVSDQTETWPALMTAITNSFKSHEKKLDGDSKNS